jgi:hypothetical protein
MHEDIQRLDEFPSHVIEPLVYLKVATATDVLERHHGGVLTDDDLQSWADALEVRYDVEPEPRYHDVLKECLFEVSAPAVTGTPIGQLASEWHQRLSELPGYLEGDP